MNALTTEQMNQLIDHMDTTDTFESRLGFIAWAMTNREKLKLGLGSLKSIKAHAKEWGMSEIASVGSFKELNSQIHKLAHENFMVA